MADNLCEVLKRWIECHLWVNPFFIFLGKVESINEVRGCFTLGIRGSDERWELIVTDILIRWQLNHV